MRLSRVSEKGWGSAKKELRDALTKGWNMSKNKVLWLLIDLALIVIICLECFFLFRFHVSGSRGQDTADQKETAVVQQTETVETETAFTQAESTTVQTEVVAEYANWSEAEAAIRDVVKQADGKWEVYLGKLDREDFLEIPFEGNVQAGAIRDLFLANEICNRIRDGILTEDNLENVEKLLISEDEKAYTELMSSLTESGMLEDAVNEMNSAVKESYPYTKWELTESGDITYTSAGNATLLLRNVSDQASAGDPYAQKLCSILAQRKMRGILTTPDQDQSWNTVEFYTQTEGRAQDFAYVRNPSGKDYQIGLMVENVADTKGVTEALSEIGDITRSYYLTRPGSGAQNDAVKGQKIAQTEQKSAQTEPKKYTAEGTAGSMSELKSALETQIAAYDGKVSVYVKDLSENEEDCLEIIGDMEQKAASLIKLYVMAAVYDQINNGVLEETEEIDRLLHDMITISDNESTNELVRRLSPNGLDWEEGSIVVNRYVRNHGYSATYMGRDVQDYREVAPVGENYTSVTDCGKILEEIYYGTCVNEAYSARMYDLLKQQTRTGKIPAGVNHAVSIANKTGELNDAEHDVAIVQLTDEQAYILCVMVTDNTDGMAVDNIISISRTVCQHFGG